MKTPFLFSLGCLLTLTAQAALPPQDFANVPWGASPDTARQAMLARGAQYQAKASKGNVLVFTGGKFAGQVVARWELKFESGQFYDGDVMLGGQEKADDIYHEMVTALSDKYGSSNQKEVAHRLPPHFVLGLGWRNGKLKKPPVHSDWATESDLNGGTVVMISTWIHGGEVHVQYMHHAEKPNGNLAPIQKARAVDDL